MSWGAVAATVVTSLIGAGVSYYGAQQQAKATEKASAVNARNARLRAQEERETAAENARRKRKDNRRRLSAMRAKAGGGGLAFEGSVLDSFTESASILEKETGEVFRQGLARGGQLSAQADMTLFEGGLQADATRTAAQGNLLSDVVSAGQSGYNTYMNA